MAGLVCLVLALVLSACCQQEADAPAKESSPAAAKEAAAPTERSDDGHDHQAHAGHEDHGQPEQPQIDNSAGAPENKEQGGFAPPPGQGDEQAQGDPAAQGEQELVDLQNTQYQVEPHDVVKAMTAQKLQEALGEGETWKLHKAAVERDGGQVVQVSGEEGALLEVLFVEKEDQDSADAYMMKLEKDTRVAMARANNKFIVVTPVKGADGESAQLLLRQAVVPLQRIPREPAKEPEGDAQEP
jgi:hypothetical protein